MTTKTDRKAGTSRFVDTEEDFHRLYEEVIRDMRLKYESEYDAHKTDGNLTLDDYLKTIEVIEDNRKKRELKLKPLLEEMARLKQKLGLK